MNLRGISGRQAVVVALSAGLLASCMHKKYETPIAKNTQQPDKVLFDQAVKDIEKGRYETARISLQTLMNTYESSEYLAKAKLAVADSWYREGGANGMAQAEAEYKDFQLFYPNMEESAEAQNRICEIHYREMDKSDRDWTQSKRAEEECRQLLIQYPNSKFAPQATQRLRNIQESLAEHEFTVGNYYWKHEMNPAAANRLNGLADQYPLYSNAGEALYEAGDAYSKMGPRFRKQAGEMFDRVVQEYPLTARAKDAAKRLQEMELPVPPADPAAVAREKFEAANYKKPGLMTRSMEWMKGAPDVSHAAKTGSPTMHDMARTIPVSVPVATNNDAGGAAGAGSGTTDVSARQVSSTDTTLDKAPDVRSTGAANTSGNTSAGGSANTAAQPLPTNRDKELKKYREQQLKKQEKLAKKKKKPDQQNQSQQNGAQPAGGTARARNPGERRQPGRQCRCRYFRHEYQHCSAAAMSKRRILLADDSPQALRLAEQILKADGIEVVSVTDGETALRRLADVNPDLLITDVYLPSKNGFELARFLQSQAAYRHLPIIFAATPTDEFNEQDAKNAGAGAILRKPFEASALLGAVQMLLDQRAAAADAEPGNGSVALDHNSIRAAVTLALDSAMPSLIEELTQRVLLALSQRR